MRPVALRVRAGVAVLMLAMATLAGARPARAAQDSVVDSLVAARTGIAPLPGMDRVLDERVKQVSSRLRCPVCQGESIQDSPAELAVQMKQLVREQLAGGQSEQQVLDYFTVRYGQWILLEPKAEGFNLLVYWLPVLFLVLGSIGIWMAVRKWTAPPASVPEAPTVSSASAPPTSPPSA